MLVNGIPRSNLTPHTHARAHTHVNGDRLTLPPPRNVLVWSVTDGTVKLWSRTWGDCIQTIAKTGDVINARNVYEVTSMLSRHYATRPDVSTLITGESLSLSLLCVLCVCARARVCVCRRLTNRRTHQTMDC